MPTPERQRQGSVKVRTSVFRATEHLAFCHQVCPRSPPPPFLGGDIIVSVLSEVPPAGHRQLSTCQTPAPRVCLPRRACVPLPNPAPTPPAAHLGPEQRGPLCSLKPPWTLSCFGECHDQGQRLSHGAQLSWLRKANKNKNRNKCKRAQV